MSMVKSNPDNVWRLVTASDEEFFVKCPSKSGAKTHLCQLKGMNGVRPFKVCEIYLPEQVPEGREIIQAHFRHPADSANWAEGNV